MKKIVIDARELRTTSGRYVEQLLHHLQRVDTDLSHRYLVLLKPRDTETWNPDSRRFTKVVCPYKEFTFAEQIGLLWQLLRLRPDLVHFAFAQQPILYQGKIVTTMHDLTTLRFDNPSKRRWIFKLKQHVYHLVNYIAAHKSKVILTPSEYVKDDIARSLRVNSRKIIVTYEAGDSLEADAEPIAALQNTQFLLYAGRPQPHKNLGRLLDAYALLKPEMSHLHLVLAGKHDALFRRYMKEVARRDLPDVHFPGFVSEGQLRWLYGHTAAYVFPSLSEGFGLPGLEAMAHGAPVVASNATCLPEVYGEAAHYFDPLDVRAMAAAIADVITKPVLRDKLVGAGYAQVKHYSWKRLAEQTLATYNSVLNS